MRWRSNAKVGCCVRSGAATMMVASDLCCSRTDAELVGACVLGAGMVEVELRAADCSGDRYDF
jgi:hypothetical protein